MHALKLVFHTVSALASRVVSVVLLNLLHMQSLQLDAAAQVPGFGVDRRAFIRRRTMIFPSFEQRALLEYGAVGEDHDRWLLGIWP
jgi:hypothetical protein